MEEETAAANRGEKRENLGGYSVEALAYLGDAVLEVLIRKRLVETGISKAGALNAKAVEMARASGQSEAALRLRPYLTAEEEALFLRGRNGGGKTHPKGSTVAQYRIATGLETLFGGLFLQGKEDRILTLFRLAFSEDSLP